LQNVGIWKSKTSCWCF